MRAKFCIGYLDGIYSYIKARSLNMDGEGGVLAGRPNGREDSSLETKKGCRRLHRLICQIVPRVFTGLRIIPSARTHSGCG